MSPRPTGRIQRAPDGFDVALSRQFADPPASVWRDVTASERTARWFGPWEGEPRIGGIIAVRLAFEDGMPTSELRIDACDVGRRLAVTMLDDYGEWRLELIVDPPADGHEDLGATRLTLVQHLGNDREAVADMVASVGPGWEYYLDMLVAARADRPLPEFDDYYPSQSSYYAGQIAQLQ
ncbi:SRPBCC family protein [Labedella populi]|uniref:SRPBCC family protein n=1 Tax=Labedella populi TaxID=2498850 RepID=A0A3S4AFT1_9MICO|nr:SRPBCC family protein [Labedella populi]RWZ67737.1 SRPBCC family protein [Labedella populi]